MSPARYDCSASLGTTSGLAKALLAMMTMRQMSDNAPIAPKTIMRFLADCSGVARPIGNDTERDRPPPTGSGRGTFSDGVSAGEAPIG